MTEVDDITCCLPIKVTEIVFVNGYRKEIHTIMSKAREHSRQRLRQAIQVIQELVPKERERFSQRRKHDLEKAHATLACHAEKLHLQVPALSTFYSPQQYLDHAQLLARQLRILEMPQAMDQEDLAWRVQPAMGEAIGYEAFSSLYQMEHTEIDNLIEMIKRYRPGLPILNCTVEWAILKQREMEAQGGLAEKDITVKTTDHPATHRREERGRATYESAAHVKDGKNLSSLERTQTPRSNAHLDRR